MESTQATINDFAPYNSRLEAFKTIKLDISYYLLLQLLAEFT
jgi:hypothetical protein